MAFDPAVGPREVDVLEDAEPAAAGRKGAIGGQARCIDHDEFTGFHVPHERGVHDIEGTGFRSEDEGVSQAAKHEGAHTEGIPHSDHRFVGERHQGVGADDLFQGIDQPVRNGAVRRQRHQVDDGLRVGCRLENGSLAHQSVAHLDRIGQIAVVGDRQATLVGLDEDGLHIAEQCSAGGRIAVVPDGGTTRQCPDIGAVREDFRHQAKAAMDMKLGTVEGNDAGGFLSTVLQGMQTEHRVGRCILGSEDTEDTALLVQPVVIEGMPRQESGHICRPLFIRRQR